MESYILALFYDERWLWVPFKINIPNSFFIKLKILTLFINLVQGLAIVFNLYIREFENIENMEVLFFMTTMFIIVLEIDSMLKLINKQTEYLSILVEAKKYDKNIELLSFERIIRRKVLETKLGIGYYIISLIKGFLCFYWTFLEFVDDQYFEICPITNNSKNIYISKFINDENGQKFSCLNNNSFSKFANYVSLIFLEKYKDFSNILMYFQIFIWAIFLIKILLLLLYLMSDYYSSLLFYIYNYNINKEVKNNEKKSISKIFSLLDNISINNDETKKEK